MPSPIEKDWFLAARKVYRNPIQLLHALYNTHCDTHMRIPSIGTFEGRMEMWLGNKGYRLMQGCLMIQNFLDKKFAQ